MDIFIFGIVLFAAFLHAAWNAIVKDGDDKILTSILVTAFGAVIAVFILPFCEQQATKESWPFIITSAAIHMVYFILVGYICRVSEMSRTYPLMRGTAPLLAALLGMFVIGEMLTFQAWIGICVICCGILSMFFAQKSPTKGTGLAFLNALLIACYTLVDGIGVRLSQAPISYILWIMFGNGVILVGWHLIVNRTAFISYFMKYWRLGMIGGIGMVLSYGLVLWAMTFSSVVMVAALRETSILFAIVISALFLKEKIGRIKVVGASIIVTGVIILRQAS